MSSKTVLVAGGAGFLGSHLCERLLEEGNKVVCVDNFQTGCRTNIFPLLTNPNFDVLRHDVTQPLYAEADEVYNLACPASPPHYQFDGIHTIKASVFGTLNLLGLCRRTKSKFVQASTSEVYGDPKEHPQSESYWGNVNTVGPRSCYDEGKRCAESLIWEYRNKHGIDAKIARIFNSYGPRMDKTDGRVVTNFIMQALNGEPLTVYGDGKQTRAFCYIEDTVEALMRLMATSPEIQGPINIGTEHEMTILELASKITDMVGSEAGLVYSPLPVDDPVQRKPCIDKAKDILGWEPVTTLETGLSKTIAYYKNMVLSEQYAGV